MFAIPSLAKLAVLAFIIFIVWQGFKLLSKNNDKSKQNKHNKEAILETETCSQCGNFIVKNNQNINCNKKNCPYKQ